MDNLVLSTRLVADARGFTGTVRQAGSELKEMSDRTRRAGSEATAAGRGLGRMGDDARAASTRVRELNRQNQSLTSGLGGLRTAIAAAGLAALARSIIGVNTQYQSLSASLKTVTGSAAAASAAFAEIEEFATKTPFQLEEVVSAFIKLKALGLDPSMAALRSYGNTASAMSRSLNQFIEAVADAATGEFERLKEFGIKASSEGDKVTFTFRGVATTVRKNASEIEGYLRRIGEVEFAGAMEEQMKTLAGVFSNLRDNVNRLFRAIGEGGLNQSIADLAGAFSMAAADGSDFGRSLGSVLGGAVSVAASAFRVLESNARIAMAVLAGFAAVKVAEVLRGIQVAALAAGKALLTFSVVATPFGAIAVAVGAASAALVYFGDTAITLRGRTATVTDYLVSAWRAVAAGVSTAWDSLERFSGGAWAQAAIDATATVGDAFAELFNAVVAVYVSIADAAVIGADAFANAFDEAIAFVARQFSDLWRALKLGISGDFTEAWDLAADVMARTFESGLGEASGRIASAVEQNFNKDWLGDWMGAAWEGAGALVGPVIDGVATDAAKRYQGRLAESLGNVPVPGAAAPGTSKPGATGGVGDGAATAERKKALADIVKLERAALEAGLSGVELLAVRRDEELEEYKKRLGEQHITEEEFAHARLLIEEIYQDEVAEIQGRARKKREDAARREAERQEELALEPWKSALGGIQGAFTDAFDNIFSGGVDSFRDLSQTVRGIMARLAAEVATLLVFRPVVGGVLGGIGLGGIAQGLGFGGTAGGGESGGTAGGGVGLGDFGSIGKSLITGFQTPALGRELGYLALNAGLGEGAANFALAAGTNLPFSAVGALGANLLGLGSGNALVDAGLGTIGGFIGAGVGGPVGAVLGSFLGTAAGGLLGFGGKASVGPNAGANVRIGPDGRAILGGAGADNGGDLAQAVAFAQSAADALNFLADMTGGSFSRTGLVGQFGSFGGQLFAGVHGVDDSYYRGGDGDQALIRTLQRSVADGLIGGLSDEIRTAVARADTASLESFFGDIQFAQSLAGIVIGDEEELTQAALALAAINDEFEELRDRANRLGLSEQTLIDARDRAIAGLKEGFAAGIEEQILAFTDPLGAALAELETAQAARLREAQELGADLVEVERLSALERAGVIERFGGAATDSLESFFNEITFGNLSGISPTGGVTGLRAAFEATAAQALAGDAGARGRIEQSGRALLEASRDFNASGAGFQSDLERVREVVGGLIGSNDNVVAAAVNNSGAQTALLLAELIDQVGRLEETSRRQAEEIEALNAEMQRQNSGAAA